MFPQMNQKFILPADQGIMYAYQIPESVTVDIKPQSCLNPLNVKSKGMLPVANLGSDVFDVNEIDIDSLEILGTKPHRSSYEDVATPVAGDISPEDCLCNTDGADGYIDLTLKFDTQEIIEAIGPVNDGDEIILTLTGFLTMEQRSKVVIVSEDYQKIE